MRKSTVKIRHDSAGEYEEELFDCDNPKRVVVCVHGGGVRRWDGEKFFYAVAEHFSDSAVLLVDQNQQNGEYIKINPLPVAVERITKLLAESKQKYPDIPVVVLAHSFGGGVASLLNLESVKSLVLVTPTAGSSFESYVERHGKDVENGLQVTTSDGLKKEYSAEFMKSIKGIVWEDKYAELMKGTVPVYVFEAGSDEIIGDERFALRNIPFTNYFILKGAHHNLSGKNLTEFFEKLDPILQ